MKRARRHSGFTLVEVVIAAAITSVILVGMASAMLIASKAAPGRTGTTEMTLQAGRATDLMSADIACATAFSILGTGSIEMTVPDRTGDGLADKVRYSWSGTSGAALYRTFNNGTAVAVANDVRTFSLGYVKAATKQATSYSESGEYLMFNTDNNLLYGAFNVPDKNAVGINFLPSIPNSAAYFRVTRADFLLVSKPLTASSEVRVNLRSGSSVSSVPSSVSDYCKMTAPSVLSGWVEATFSQNAQLTPGNTVNLTVARVGGSTDFTASIRTGVNIANANLCYSTDSGNSWSIDSSRTLPAYVYGVYGTKNADAYNYNLTHVTCTLKCGNSPIAQVRSDFRALNQPQVSGP